jgi:restriction system protein
MLGFGPLGSMPLGGGPMFISDQMDKGRKIASLIVGGLIIPERQEAEGILVKSYAAAWIEIVRYLGDDWNLAFSIKPRVWEEILAGAFDKAGFTVTLTPSTGDHGRDVIAVKHGVGCMRILGSMKAYSPDHVVTREHVHEMLGVLNAEGATKGVIATTSNFAPKILDAPGLATSVPYRLELMNGDQLQKWLEELAIDNDAQTRS